MPNLQLPGGNLLAGFGGYIQMWNWMVAGGTGATAVPINFQYLDVLRWSSAHHKIATPITFSGSRGAVRRRSVATDWSVKCSVWYDYNYPPNMVVAKGDTLAIKLILGADESWSGDSFSSYRLEDFASTPPTVANHPVNGLPANGMGILPAPDDEEIPGLSAYIPSYVAPSCICTHIGTYDSSEGDEIVRMDLQFDGDSLLWYLPDQATEDLYATYVQNLARDGLLSGNTA